CVRSVSFHYSADVVDSRFNAHGHSPPSTPHDGPPATRGRRDKPRCGPGAIRPNAGHGHRFSDPRRRSARLRSAYSAAAIRAALSFSADEGLRIGARIEQSVQPPIPRLGHILRAPALPFAPPPLIHLSTPP